MKKIELRELVDNGVLQQKPVPELIKSELKNLVKDGFLQKLPNEFFAFNNNLTWEVIYDSLLFSERRYLHNLIAKHIELHNLENLDSVADMLLHHYNEADNWEKCIYFASIAGDRATSMYAIEDAITSYRQALSALKLVNESHGLNYSLINERIGDAYFMSGQSQESCDAFQDALSIWIKTEKTIRKSKYVNLSWKINARTQESSLCRKIAMTYQELSKYDESLKWLNNATNKLPQRPGIVTSQIYASKSGSYYRKGQLQEAFEWGKKALSIAKRLKNDKETAYAHKAMANALLGVGKIDQAINQLTYAAKCYEDLEDIIGISTTYNNIGGCFHLLGRLDEAVLNYMKALDLSRRLHNEARMAMLNNNLGEICLLRGQYEKAINHFESTVSAYNNGKCEKSLTGLTFVNLCRCYRAKNKLSISEAHLVRAQVLLNEVGSDTLIMESEIEKIELILDKKELKKAFSLSQELLEKIKKLNVPPLLIRAERVLGDTLVANNEIAKAKFHYLESISLAKKLNAEYEEAKSIIALTIACIRSNTQDKKLNKLIKHAITILENMGAELDLAQAKDLQTKLDQKK